MTAFDERLYHTLETLAAGGGRVQIGVRQLADILDVSDRTIRDARQRLERAGRLTITPAEDRFRPDILTLRDPQPARDLTEGLRCEREPTSGAPAGVKPPPYSPSATGDTTPKRQPDPDCPVCDGSGWMYLPEPPDTVEPCRCITDDYRAWWRAQRRRTLNSWPKQHDEPPAKADYTATMLEWNRRQLEAAKPPKRHNGR